MVCTFTVYFALPNTRKYVYKIFCICVSSYKTCCLYCFALHLGDLQLQLLEGPPQTETLHLQVINIVATLDRLRVVQRKKLGWLNLGVVILHSSEQPFQDQTLV